MVAACPVATARRQQLGVTAGWKPTRSISARNSRAGSPSCAPISAIWLPRARWWPAWTPGIFNSRSRRAQAQVKQAQRAIDEANADLEQQRRQQTLAAQELDRTQSLLKNGYATKELFDQRKQAMDAANAGTEMALYVLAYNMKRIMRILGGGGLASMYPALQIKHSYCAAHADRSFDSAQRSFIGECDHFLTKASDKE